MIELQAGLGPDFELTIEFFSRKELTDEVIAYQALPGKVAAARNIKKAALVRLQSLSGIKQGKCLDKFIEDVTKTGQAIFSPRLDSFIDQGSEKCCLHSEKEVRDVLVRAGAPPT